MLRRLLGAERPPEAPLAGEATAMDGLTALAMTESRVSDTVALGATFPAAAAGRAWTRRQMLDDVNAMQDRLQGLEVPTPHGSLAAALGASMAGQRATTFLSGPDLAGATDLLHRAVGRHAPLVVHVTARSSAFHAQALGSGHEAYHAAAASGCLLLFAVNVQEAVDLALIARRVAESSLVPALVFMDSEQTALAIQDVCLPEPELIREFLGDPSMPMETPTDAQRMLFGPTRRRVPRLFDLERPLLHGPWEGPESWALGAIGQQPYFGTHVATLLDEAFGAFAGLTGRRYDSAQAEAVDGADCILVAQGSAVETAAAVCEHLRTHDRLKIGVLGIRCLRPLPDDRIARSLQGARVAAIMERTAMPLGEGPLLGEIRGTLNRARECARFGEAIHPGCRPIDDPHLARLVNVSYGLGGRPLRASDIVALLKRIEPTSPSPIHLGIEFAPRSAYPKHQALSDALRRSDPALASLGLSSPDPPPDIRPVGATTIAIHRLADEHHLLAGDAAALLHELHGHAVRSRPAVTSSRVDQACTDTLTVAESPVRDPGDDVAIDVAIAAAESPSRLSALADRLAPGGAVLLVSSAPDEALIAAVPVRVRDSLQAEGRRLFAVQGPADGVHPESTREEALLGGLIAVLRDRSESEAPSLKVIREARRQTLSGLPEHEVERRLEIFAAACENLRVIPLETEMATGGAGDETVARTPATVERLSRGDGTAFSLSRFWDHAGAFYRNEETRELFAEPGMALGVVPPLTGALHDASAIGSVLPALDPESCDGDPRLWMTCPDGSLAPLVIGVRALIDAGIRLAGERGRPADALLGAASKLATQARKIIAASDSRWITARQLLEQALAPVLETVGDDRGAALRAALDDVVEIIGDLPLVRTVPFFDDAEREATGSGELFSLVVNPDACRSAPLVIAAATGRGIRAVPRTPDNIEAARRLWSIWEHLPDTSGTTIARARQHEAIGPLAAVMLSRHCSQAAAGGDCAESGSGAKLALRRVLAVAESVYQPRLQKFIDETSRLREQLAAAIREVLAEGLPTSDL
ncbi:MAG: hypothetical protein ACYTGG_06710, partial [Planctomycetota bacterium]